MNKDTKLLFFDIDGTLITDDGQRYLPDSCVKAIREARAKGHKVFINTGRVYVNVDQFLRDIGFDGYVCACGGCIVVDDEILYYHTLDKARCVEVARKVKELGMEGLYEHKDFITMYGDVGKYKDMGPLLKHFEDEGHTVYTDIEDDHFIFDKFCAWFEEGSDLTEFKEFIKDDFDYIDRGPIFCEVVPKGVSKATGIQFLLDYYGLPLENAYAFGDGYNDEPMLCYVKNSVIMQKGPEDLKAKCMMVTEDVREHGIYNAMRKLGIIDGE